MCSSFVFVALPFPGQLGLQVPNMCEPQHGQVQNHLQIRRRQYAQLHSAGKRIPPGRITVRLHSLFAPSFVYPTMPGAA